MKALLMRNDDGQSTVEFALVIPVLALFLMLIIQVAIIARTYVSLSNASRVVARELAVNNDSAYAIKKGNSVESNISYSISRPSSQGQYLVVGAKKKVKSNLPLLKIIFPDVTIESKTTMRVEK